MGDDGGVTLDGDLLRLRETYPDAAAIFSWVPRSLDDAKADCLVALDTNTLVVPYETSQKTLDEIGSVYAGLVDQERLVVPGQVAREFAGARMVRLTEMRQNLSRKLTSLTAPDIGKYPILEGLEEYQEARQLESAMRGTLESYKSTIKSILEQVGGWGVTDPVTELYRKLIRPAVVVDLTNVDATELREERDRRVRNKLPPGYKDQAKTDGGVGDLLIWQTLLELGRDREKDLVFVTSDNKGDWWHRSDGAALYPRHELVEEYRRASSGRTFHMLSLAELLNLFDVSDSTLKEVTEAEWRPRRTKYSDSSILLNDGDVVVVRHRGRYGAFQAIEQTSEANGASIAYRWWYQPDGTANFFGPVHEGHGRASERTSSSPIVEVGPIQLEWSVGGDGFGWIYFGPPGRHSNAYAFAFADVDSISSLEFTDLDFFTVDD